MLSKSPMDPTILPKGKVGDGGGGRLAASAAVTALIVSAASLALARDTLLLWPTASIIFVAGTVGACSMAIARRAKSPCAGAAGAAAILIAAQLIHVQFPSIRAALLVALGIAACISLRGSFHWQRNFAVSKLNLLVNGVVAAAAVMTAHQYADYLVQDRLLAGNLHQDTLYHASIVSMFKTHGVASTGLNGLVPISYHVLFHRLCAGMSALSGVPVVYCIGVFEMVVLSPLLVGALAYAAVALGKVRDAQRVNFAWRACSLCLLATPLLKLASFAVWDSWFVSESYTLSLCLMLFALPALLSRESRTSDFAWACVTAILAGLSKGSVGVYIFAIAGVGIISAPGSKRMAARLAMTAISFAVFALSMAGTGSESLGSFRFSPLFYAQLHSIGGKNICACIDALGGGASQPAWAWFVAITAALAFLAAHFLFAWIAIGFRLFREGLSEMLKDPPALAVMVCLAIGISAAMFELIGIFYCFNPAMFVSIPVLVAITDTPRVQACISAAVVIATAGLAVSVDDGLKYKMAPPGERSLRGSGGTDRGSALFRLQERLARMRSMDLGSEVVWTMNEEMRDASADWNCTRRPFVFPALTERAWIGAIDPRNCTFEAYGYSSYFGPNGAILLPVLPRWVTPKDPPPPSP